MFVSLLKVVPWWPPFRDRPLDFDEIYVWRRVMELVVHEDTATDEEEWITPLPFCE